MPTIRRGIIDAANKAYKDLFQSVLEENTDRQLMALTTDVPSTAKVEEYDWFQDFADFRLWQGERKLSDQAAYNHIIRNEKYEATVSMDREDMDYDRLGKYEPKIQQLARAWPRLLRSRVAELIVNGHNPSTPRTPEVSVQHVSGSPEYVGYDDEPFFSDTHPNSAGADQSNQTQAQANDADFDNFDGEDVDAAVEKMQLLRDDGGRLIDVMPDTLVVGPKNRTAVRRLFQKETVAEGGDNEYFGMFDQIIVDPYLREVRDAYIFDTSLALQPIIRQTVNGGPEFASLTSPDSDHVFKNDEFLYGARAIFGMGYGLWQVGHRIIAA